MNYDSSYHKVFSNPEMVKDLMQHFVKEGWVAQLDFSTLQRVNAKFHSDQGKRREGDVIFKVNTIKGGIAYLYLLLEFLCGAPHKNSYVEPIVMWSKSMFPAIYL
jgi:hypothetical protein